MTYFTQEPEAINYMPLPDGRADVWLRAEITKEDDMWTAQEVYFRTTLSLKEITKNFDTLFKNGGPEVDEDTGEEAVEIEITLKERVAALEEKVKELAEK